ncbi:hypothetical protein [Halocatena marina]|uniref:DUF4184 family protein n=1 Tax=Halocatena marina TaxID=2934937 RepID=A0ABD5YW93_9EURY|nr:hypothetical protein [Halocatena marina]
MPFTLYHLGPVLVFGLPFRNRIDLATLCIASVVLDTWPALVLFGVLPGPYHWIWHTYLGAAVITGMLTSGIVLGARRFPTQFDRFRIGQRKRTEIASTALVGTWLHVTFDSITHPTMNPFAPVVGNPFSVYLSPMYLTLFCDITLIIGLAWLVMLYTINTRSAEETSRTPSSTSSDGLVAVGPLQLMSSSIRHRLIGTIIVFISVGVLLLVDPTHTVIRSVTWSVAGGVMLFNGLYLTGIRFQWTD